MIQHEIKIKLKIKKKKLPTKLFWAPTTKLSDRIVAVKADLDAPGKLKNKYDSNDLLGIHSNNLIWKLVVSAGNSSVGSSFFIWKLFFFFCGVS